jgi:hypothetical protein
MATFQASFRAAIASSSQSAYYMYCGWRLQNGVEGDKSGFVDYVERTYHKQFFIVNVRNFLEHRQDPAKIQNYLASRRTVIDGIDALTTYFTSEERVIIDAVLNDTRHFTAKFLLTAYNARLSDWTDEDYQSWITWYDKERDFTTTDETFTRVPAYYRLDFMKWLGLQSTKSLENNSEETKIFRQITRPVRAVSPSTPATEEEIEALIVDWLKDQIDDHAVDATEEDIARLPDPAVVELFQKNDVQVEITGEVYLYPKLLAKYGGVLAVPMVPDAETWLTVADAFATIDQVRVIRNLVKNSGRELVIQLGL